MKTYSDYDKPTHIKDHREHLYIHNIHVSISLFIKYIINKSKYTDPLFSYKNIKINNNIINFTVEPHTYKVIRTN